MGDLESMLVARTTDVQECRVRLGHETRSKDDWERCVPPMLIIHAVKDYAAW